MKRAWVTDVVHALVIGVGVTLGMLLARVLTR